LPPPVLSDRLHRGGGVFETGRSVERRLPHRHRELEVNLVTAGQAHYVVSGVRFELRRNTQLWLFPGQEHVLLEESPDFAMWIGVFDRELVGEAASGSGDGRLRETDPAGRFCAVLEARAASGLRDLYEQVRLAYDEPWRCRVGLLHLLAESWSAHWRSPTHATASELHPGVERAIRLIREQSAGGGEPALPELARRCGLSPARLSRLFARQTGMTLTRYRQRRRLDAALELLQRRPRLSLSQAALRSGFGSYPQFHRVFRELIGESPSAFRARRLAEAAASEPTSEPADREGSDDA
jgi:AraC-like DNA-binding protein